MAKDVIHVDGEDVVVREDTAKAYRGVNWAWLSIGIFLIIMILLAGAFFLKGGAEKPTDPPSRGVTQ
jgi:hypothetical protein